MTNPSVSLERTEPLRLLVVDDDDVDRDRVKRLLAKLHLKSSVTEASSLNEARTALGLGDFDCVFLDYQMGDGVGTELLQDIGYGSLNYVPVVMVTGNDNERLLIEVMQNGAYDFIPKSQLQVDLLETVLINSLLRANLEREVKAKRERLEHLSFYDSLTDLPNRALFFDRLEQALLEAQRNKRVFAVMQMDLNLFKEINDNYGHEVGDTVLTVAAQRIKKVLRESDTVARLGGDEFAAVLIDIASEDDAHNVADKIAAAISEPIATDAHLISITAAVGMALYPAQGEDAHTLLVKADRAMYAAKKMGSLHLLYADGMDSGQQRPMLEVSSLQQAIEHNELFVEYQPIVELNTRKVTGFEALVRWRKPNGETVPPGVFIPFAERNPIIRPLSYCVLDQVFKQIQTWQAQGLQMPVSVNMSARMLDDDDLPRRVLAGLSAHAIHPALLTLELTETALMYNLEQAKKILGLLIQQGVQVSVDDFGAGFTSFKYLRQMHVSEIKIDMAFTADVQDGSRDSVIIRSIATLANGFGIHSVAEGIEDLHNWGPLQALGCTRGQGYGIARPMAGSSVPAWLDQWENQMQPGAPLH